VRVTDSTSPTAQTGTASFYHYRDKWDTPFSLDDVGHKSIVCGIGIQRLPQYISGSGYALINSTPVSGLAYTDATVVNGQTYYYVLTAVDPGGDESDFSHEIQEDIP